MKKNIFIIIIITLCTTSCSNFLDVKPAGKKIPANGDVESFDKLLNNTNTIDFIYQNNNRGSSLPYLTDDLEISDNQAKGAWYNGHPNIDSYFAYIYKTPYGNPAVQDYYWNWGFYRAAQYFNSCIDGVNGVRTPDVEKKANEVIAQAIVARAWGYFYATLGYGPVYKPKGNNTTLTIPYRTSSDIMSKMEMLSTQQEVFNRVLSDIHSQIKNIPEQVGSNTRFGKIQTYAFLSYYHLFTQQFDSVAFYADKCLNLAAAQNGGKNNLFYDMNKFKWGDPNVASNPDARSSASINTSEGTVALSETMQREICLYRTCSSAPTTTAYPSKEFLDLFDATNDLRREYFFFEYFGFKKKDGAVSYDDGRRILNYQGKISRTSGYTYPEILLMRAEGYARTGQLDKALDDLRFLRKLRMKPGTPDLNITGQDNIIMEVLTERRRELPVGSPKRFFDLKRFSLEIGKPWAKENITHIVESQTYTGKVDSKLFVLPIRNDVIRWNPHWGIPLESAPWSNSK